MPRLLWTSPFFFQVSAISSAVFGGAATVGPRAALLHQRRERAAIQHRQHPALRVVLHRRPRSAVGAFVSLQPPVELRHQDTRRLIKKPFQGFATFLELKEMEAFQCPGTGEHEGPHEKIEGVFKTYYKNGQLESICKYVNEMAEGLYKQYYEIDL